MSPPQIPGSDLPGGPCAAEKRGFGWEGDWPEDRGRAGSSAPLAPSGSDAARAVWEDAGPGAGWESSRLSPATQTAPWSPRSAAPRRRRCSERRELRGGALLSGTWTECMSWIESSDLSATSGVTGWPCSSQTSSWEMLGPWLRDWRRSSRGRRCSFWGTRPMAEALATLLRPRYLDLLVSSPALPLPGGSRSPDPEPLERFGRRFPLAPGRRLEEYGAFYVGGSEAISDPDLDPDLSRLLLGWAPGRPFSSCCPDTGRTQDEGARAGRLRARRRYLVERARDARVVGLLAGTLGVARHREALAHLRSLTQAAGKRSYVLALGRPTPAKLANFPEVDVFVLLACPLSALAPQSSGNFFRPVLAPCELEAACNPAWPPPGLAPHLTHYADLLPGSPFHVPLPPPDSELWDTPDVSLITGGLRPPPAWTPSTDSGCSALTLRPQQELVESSPAASFLSSRSWQGLQPRLGQTPVTGAVSGRRGIAIAYEDEGSS
uniref:Diphtheria toxin resistance protein 2 n=1 Tax=Sus scrofa TaxID=9823 RepID=A0A8D0WBU6_PIG